MTNEEILINISKAIKDFFNKGELLSYSCGSHSMINERNITSNLNKYLSPYFKEYDVDCEYNRDMNDIKRINGINVNPDIIIHKKMTSNNLVWIEVKKETNNQKEEYDYDRNKIMNATKTNVFSYQLGIFIIISVDINKIKIELYEKGKLINFDNDLYKTFYDYLMQE